MTAWSFRADRPEGFGGRGNAERRIELNEMQGVECFPFTGLGRLLLLMGELSSRTAVTWACFGVFADLGTD